LTLLLAVQDLHCGYGADEIIHGIDLTVEEGEAVSILGPNGCGKSTLVKAILGYVRITAGTASYRGIDILGRSAEAIMRLGIGYVPQLDNVFKPMTVRENLELGGHRMPRRLLDREIERLFTVFPLLAERRTQLAGTLSGGERQLLAMARALMAAPRLLVLDEPSAGLSPIKVSEVFEHIGRIVDLGTAVLLIEQNVGAALAVSDRTCVLAAGKVVFCGSPSEALQAERMRDAYLGALSETDARATGAARD
jgi:ABC-type branched-subunit amino acid transport system ATPase component